MSSLRDGAEQDLQDLELLAAAAGDRDDVRASIDRLRARIEARLGSVEAKAAGSRASRRPRRSRPLDGGSELFVLDGVLRSIARYDTSGLGR